MQFSLHIPAIHWYLLWISYVIRKADNLSNIHKLSPATSTSIGPVLQATKFNNDSAVPPLLTYGCFFRMFLKKKKYCIWNSCSQMSDLD